MSWPGAWKAPQTLYNTYWVRFPRGSVTYDSAVANTKALISAPEAAGVRRIVHISITNASEHSLLPYFRGKGQLGRAIERSKLSHAIVRPTRYSAAKTCSATTSPGP